MPKISPKEVAQALSEPVAALLVAKAVAEVERERVDKIQRRVLATGEFHGQNSRRNGSGKRFRVTEPKDAYLMDEADAQRYFGILNAIHVAEGFEKANEGWCPALTAEDGQLKAEWALIEAARKFFPDATNHALLASGGCEMRKKYLDLIIGLVLAAQKKVA